MNRSEVEFLIDLLKIYSPSEREAEIASYLSDKMRGELGFKDVRIDRVSNVIGEIGRGMPVILLCGHMDTVPGELPVYVSGNSIYGRGAVDAKSSLAALVLAASRLSEYDGIGKIIVAAVIDEEGSSAGVKAFLEQPLKVDYAIFGEPSGIGSLTIGYKGRVAIKISCRAEAVHASAPWLTENAIERVFEVWEAIKRYSKLKADSPDRYRSLTSCLTTISGGSSHNVTPAESRLTVDIRVPPQLSAAKIADEVRQIVQDFHAVDLEFLDVTEPYEADKRSLLVRAFTKAVLEVRGKVPSLLKKTGTGDMNFLAAALKISAVTYGPGDPHLAHTDREAIEVTEFLTSIDIIVKAVTNLHKLSQR